MKSTTSCFNSTLYHKTMARFWPIWAGYTLVLLFMLPLNMLNTYFRYAENFTAGELAQNIAADFMVLPNLLSPLILILFPLALLCAMASFGYLYNHRSACMMHALPMKRDTLYVTEYLAGLSFLILPALLTGAVTAVTAVFLCPGAQLGEIMGIILLMVLVLCAAALFFYSFAVFCAMFTGHILALPVFYGVLSFLVYALYGLLNLLMHQFFYGFNSSLSSGGLVSWCTPLPTLGLAAGWDYAYDSAGNVVEYHLHELQPILVYAVVGLIFAVAALFVYRARHVESAGDVVSVPLVRPLFKASVSFCVGLFFGSFTATFFSWGNTALCVMVVLWSVVGWFAAEMLLQKSFRVFRRSWKSCAVMTVLMAALCVSFSMDLFGIEARVPAAEDVKSMTVYLDMGYPQDDGSGVELRLEDDPELMDEIIALHQAAVNERDYQESDPYLGPTGSHITVTFHYELKNGRTLSRSYFHLAVSPEDLDRDGSVAERYAALLENRELAARAYRLDLAQEKDVTLVGVELHSMKITGIADYADYPLADLTGTQRRELWDAVLLDFEEGTIGKRYLFDDRERYENTMRTDLVFYFNRPIAEDGLPHATAEYWDGSDYSAYADAITITLTPNARHTLDALDRLGVLDENHQLVPHDPSSYADLP